MASLFHGGFVFAMLRVLHYLFTETNSKEAKCLVVVNMDPPVGDSGSPMRGPGVY
jgi:hypothetical protein